MATVEVPLQHTLLYRSTKVGSAWALPRHDADRLWRNLGWALTPTTVEPGPDVDHRCKTCDATWVGPAGESCWWCERRAEWLAEGQRTLVMSEPDVDVLDASDDELQTAVEAWATRLRVAVKAELVTELEADRVIEVFVEKAGRWRSEL
jgi:hypothetical protein